MLNHLPMLPFSISFWVVPFSMSHLFSKHFIQNMFETQGKINSRYFKLEDHSTSVYIPARIYMWALYRLKVGCTHGSLVGLSTGSMVVLHAFAHRDSQWDSHLETIWGPCQLPVSSPSSLHTQIAHSLTQVGSIRTCWLEGIDPHLFNKFDRIIRLKGLLCGRITRPISQESFK